MTTKRNTPWKADGYVRTYRGRELSIALRDGQWKWWVLYTCHSGFSRTLRAAMRAAERAVDDADG